MRHSKKLYGFYSTNIPKNSFKISFFDWKERSHIKKYFVYLHDKIKNILIIYCYCEIHEFLFKILKFLKIWNYEIFLFTWLTVNYIRMFFNHPVIFSVIFRPIIFVYLSLYSLIIGFSVKFIGIRIFSLPLWSLRVCLSLSLSLFVLNEKKRFLTPRCGQLPQKAAKERKKRRILGASLAKKLSSLPQVHCLFYAFILSGMSGLFWLMMVKWSMCLGNLESGARLLKKWNGWGEIYKEPFWWIISFLTVIVTVILSFNSYVNIGTLSVQNIYLQYRWRHLYLYV